MQISDIVLVGIGGGVGSLGRWLIGLAVGERYHGSLPLGTFIINVSGAFVIGFLSVYFGIEWHSRYGGLLSSGVLTGVLGGYTTFSSMQLDAYKLNSKQKPGLAVFYLLVSVLIGLLFAWLGAGLARVMV